MSGTKFDWEAWDKKREEYAERCFSDWISQPIDDEDDNYDDEYGEYDCYEQE